MDVCLRSDFDFAVFVLRLGHLVRGERKFSVVMESVLMMSVLMGVYQREGFVV